MKLLYISVTFMDFDNIGGVQRKLLSQTKAFVELGMEVDMLIRSNGRIILYDVMQKRIVNKYNGSSKYDIYKIAKTIIDKYSYIYIRYPMSDPLFFSLLRTCRRFKAKVVVEIPTYPYDRQIRMGILGIRTSVVTWIDKIFRKNLKHYVDRICTYSLDSEIYGIKTINTINGYDFSSVSPSLVSPNVEECINMIAVSGMHLLHGYDRMIEGLDNYYRNGGKRNLVLHVVGSGEIEPDYKILVKKLGMEKHVIFHGKQFGANLVKCYSGQALGVNSLAIHREGLKRESTLKTREYGAYGLPVISSSYVDAFSENGNDKYVLHVPADDSPININDLISFVDNIYSDRDIEELRAEIRSDAQVVSDMAITMKPVVSYFCENR